MKILIVDDNSSKISHLKKIFVESCNIAESDITVAVSAIDAKRLLMNQRFDLMILDILLPSRPETEPEMSNSLGLLEDIHAGRIKKPDRIVGLTAFSDAAAEVMVEFQNKLWTVLQYDQTSTDWQDSIKDTVKYIRDVEVERSVAQYKFDLCVITTTSVEYAAMKNLPWNWQAPTILDDNSFYMPGTLQINSETFSVACIQSPRMGMVQSALTAAKVIERLKPRFLSMIGICAGLENDTNFGDIILADVCWDYQSGKWTSSNNESIFSIDPHQIRIDSFIRSRFEVLQGDQEVWRDIKDSWPGTKPCTELSFYVGPIATGSAVLADGSLQKIKGAQGRKLMGAEMEIYGVYAAGMNAAIPRPTVFALKSVSDFGKNDKDDSYQKYAAYTSVQALNAFLSRFLLEIRSMAGT